MGKHRTLGRLCGLKEKGRTRTLAEALPFLRFGCALHPLGVRAATGYARRAALHCEPLVSELLAGNFARQWRAQHAAAPGASFHWKWRLDRSGLQQAPLWRSP